LSDAICPLLLSFFSFERKRALPYASIIERICEALYPPPPCPIPAASESILFCIFCKVPTVFSSLRTTSYVGTAPSSLMVRRSMKMEASMFKSSSSKSSSIPSLSVSCRLLILPPEAIARSC
jgi:hypothetical protein